MAVINRASLAPPTLPRETVEVEALGGDVVVRGLLLTERMKLESRMTQAAQEAREAAPKGAADNLDAGVAAVLPMLLAATVLDADSNPLWTTDEWQIFGGKHPQQAVALFNVAWRLAGLDRADNEKN
jgi:hypothetical protein